MAPWLRRTFGTPRATRVWAAVAVLSFVLSIVADMEARLASNRQDARGRAFQTCIIDYLTANQHRSDQITTAQGLKDQRNDEYNTANNVFIHDLFGLVLDGVAGRAPTAAHRNGFVVATRNLAHASERLLQASNALNNVRKANPVLPPPRLVCPFHDVYAGSTPHPTPTVLLTVTPAPRTATQTATATRNVPTLVPGPAVIIPGPTRTRTVTVTATPTPTACRHHCR